MSRFVMHKHKILSIKKNFNKTDRVIQSDVQRAGEKEKEKEWVKEREWNV